MALIAKPEGPLNPYERMGVPNMEVPSFRQLLAKERGTTENILIISPYALGDCVCSEPAIRYAIEAFKGCKISIATHYPELFSHLQIEKFYVRDEKPDFDKYNVYECYHSAESLQSEYVHNFNMAIEDYIATSLFKGQIPVADRDIRCRGEMPRFPPGFQNKVIIHPGKSWLSKSFPKEWWDQVIQGIAVSGVTPILIGAVIDNGKRGTVDVDTKGCQDLRNKLTVTESLGLLQNAEVVLTNDSAPLHMAASGKAHIGFMSTVRHADFIKHWRKDETGENQWGYRMRDFARGTMWTPQDMNPITAAGKKYDVIDYATMMKWLPEPETLVQWTMQKLGGH